MFSLMACSSGDDSPIVLNTNPEITSIHDQTIYEDTAMSPVSFTITDAETDASNLSLSSSTSDKSIVSPDNIVFEGRGESRILTLTPSLNQSGVVRVTVNVSDGKSSASESFNLTIISVADQPILKIYPVTAGMVNSSIPITILTAAPYDADGSEQLSDIKIMNVPYGASLSAGNDLHFGEWKLHPSQISNLNIIPPRGNDNDFLLTFVLSSSETATGESASTTKTMKISIFEKLLAPQISISNLKLMTDGNQTLYCQQNPPYHVTGNYQGFPGYVTVTAHSQSEHITGYASSGTFNLSLPEDGEWDIQLLDVSTQQQKKCALNLKVDSKSPDLSIDFQDDDSKDARMTSIEINGSATDADSGIKDIVIQSNRYPDSKFYASFFNSYRFTCYVPLKAMDNQLTITASDHVGNKTEETLTVSVMVTETPEIIIREPLNQSLLNQAFVDIKGIIRSELDSGQIKVQFLDQLAFPEGSSNEYTFEFNHAALKEGINNLIVSAETAYTRVSESITVNYIKTSTTRSKGPAIEIWEPKANTYITTDYVNVSGLATSTVGVKSIWVNNKQAEIVDDDSSVSFKVPMWFPSTGEDTLTIDVIAYDHANYSTIVLFDVKYDMKKPDLILPGIELPPSINEIIDNPYMITGLVSDKNLAGVSINDQSIGVVPGTNPEEWLFETQVLLNKDQASITQKIVISAWDQAHNTTTQEVTFKNNASRNIEIISPSNVDTLTSTEAIKVTVRISDIADTDLVFLSLDNGEAIQLSRTGNFASGLVSLENMADGHHKISVYVQDQNEQILARTFNNYLLIDSASEDIAVDRVEPDINEEGIEPNSFIAIYFNQSIDPSKVAVEVFETVHGLVYNYSYEKGTDVNSTNDTEMIEVNKDMSPVKGGVGHFPQNMMMAFYPENDFVYGATIYLSVSYDTDNNGEKEEIFKSSFMIRPLPTFIQGFVADQFMVPVEGIDINIPDIGRSTKSDSNGSFAFGFGDSAGNALPSGRYKAIINPDMKNNKFGMVEQWILIKEGRINQTGVIKIPILNEQVPYLPLNSNEIVQLADNELTLTLTNTTLTFPDGKDNGLVHVQFMQFEQFSYTSLPATIPHWVFSFQPSTINVSGDMGMSFKMPLLQGSHEYIETYIENSGNLVLLVGLDPKSLMIMPVGVGKIDHNSKTVSSQGDVALKRLDYMGYALVAEEKQSVLQQYSEGKLSIPRLIGEFDIQ